VLRFQTHQKWNLWTVRLADLRSGGPADTTRTTAATDVFLTLLQRLRQFIFLNQQPDFHFGKRKKNPPGQQLLAASPQSSGLQLFYGLRPSPSDGRWDKPTGNSGGTTSFCSGSIKIST